MPDIDSATAEKDDLVERRQISDAYSDWAWEKEGSPVGLMLPNDAARAAFFAGARWAKASDSAAGQLASMRDALTASLPLLETLHSVIPLGDARRTVLKAVMQTRAALNASPESAGQDIRWAVNVLLEKIAAKFEANETMDIWRSDAAATVRSFKHETAALTSHSEGK